MQVVTPGVCASTINKAPN